jgi:hypothetical protein
VVSVTMVKEYQGPPSGLRDGAKRRAYGEDGGREVGAGEKLAAGA